MTHARRYNEASSAASQNTHETHLEKNRTLKYIESDFI